MRSGVFEMLALGGEGHQLAINVEGDRLVGVLALVAGSRVVVKGWVSAERPAGVDAADAAAMGKWVNGELERAGMLVTARKSRVIFAVPRGEVVMKRIAFPPGVEDADLPGMVHLQMARQLTVSPESAAIDYVPIPTTGMATANAAGKAGTTVLAVALQGDRVQWRREVARGAGLRLSRIALKSAGSAALLAEASAKRGAGVLGVALGCGSTEFVVVEDGQLVSARATDLVRPEGGMDARHAEEETFAEKVAVEAKRTWMSYRVTAESAEIESVAVLGADDLSKRLAARCAESMEIPAAAADYPGVVELPKEMTARDRSAVAPLVGLIAEPVVGRATLDFANPRRAPDLVAAVRQKALLGAMAAILVLGGGFTAMRLDLSNRQADLEGLKETQGGSRSTYEELVRSKARLEHLRRFMDTKVDWLAHLSLLSEQMPDPRQAQLDSIGGYALAAVVYQKPEGVRGVQPYTEEWWAQGVEGVFSVVGRMKARDVADELRAKLVSDQRYRLESTGADTWNRFAWKLTTNRGVPEKLGAGGGKVEEVKKAPEEKKGAPGKAEEKKPAGKPGDKKVGMRWKKGEGRGEMGDRGAGDAEERGGVL